MEHDAMPSEAVFASHGLSKISLDLTPLQQAPLGLASILSPSATYHATEEWLSGSAELIPTTTLPLLVNWEDVARPVRFIFCPWGDSAIMARFRRQAQIIVLDTLPPPSRSPSASSSSTLHRHYGRIKQVIAWWEDDTGLWLITDEDTEERRSLVEWWSQLMVDEEDNDVVERTEKMRMNGSGIHSEPKTGPSSLARYGAACGTLLSVINCLRVRFHFSRYCFFALQQDRP